MKIYCRVCSVVEAWCNALEFARSTTVKYQALNKIQLRFQGLFPGNEVEQDSPGGGGTRIN